MSGVVSRALTAAVACAVLSVVLGGCAGGSPRDSASPPKGNAAAAEPGSGIDVSAHVDPARGTIEFPSDRYIVTSMDQTYLLSAQDVYVESCLIERGFPEAAGLARPAEPLYGVSLYFGVWTADIASRFGFAAPMTEGDLAANGITINGEPVTHEWAEHGDDYYAAMRECRKEPEAAEFGANDLNLGGPWAQEFDDATNAALESDAAQKVYDEYDACLIGKGLQPHPDVRLTVLGGQSDDISEEQIKLALEVVDCKTQVNAVQRLSDEVAARQAPVVERYAKELTALKADIDGLVREAQDVLAGAGLGVSGADGA